MGVGGREEASSLTRGSLWEHQGGRVLSTPGQPAKRSRSSGKFRSGASRPWNQTPASFCSRSALLSPLFLICEMGLLKKNPIYWREDL